MIKSYLSILSTKLRSVFDFHLCFSAIIMDSKLDRTAAVRQNARLYHVSLGKYSYVCRDSLIQHTEVGSFTSISEGCVIGLPKHPLNMVSTSPVFLQGENYLKKHFANFPFEDCSQTRIGNDVWIGTRAQIMSGLTVGDGAVIASGAIVTHDVIPYSIVAGVPARVIGTRASDELVKQLLDDPWWEKKDEEIFAMAGSFSNMEDYSKNNNA